MMRSIIAILLAAGIACSASAQTREVKIYFSNHALELRDQNAGDSTAMPVGMYPALRTVSPSYAARQALHQLLVGPTAAEKDSGYTSDLTGLKLVRLTIHEGRATVHLRGPLRLSGALSGLRMRKQVERTLLQFRRIHSVALVINGRRSFDSTK